MKIVLPKYRIIAIVIANLFFLNTINAQIALRSTTTTQCVNSAAPSITITHPSSLVVGDVMIANIGIRGKDNKTYPTNSNWTSIGSNNYEDGGQEHRFVLYYKVVTSEDIAGSTTFTFSSGDFNTYGGIAAFSGVNTANVLDLPIGSFSKGTSVTPAAGAITTVTNGAAVLMCVGTFETSTVGTFTLNSVSGSTLFGSSCGSGTSGAGAGLGWWTQSTAGVTGSGSAILSSSKKWGAILLALRPLTTPTIGTFTDPSKTYGDVPFNITAPSSNSSGAFTYTSSNTSVATISGATVTIVGSGASTITVTQAANGSYSSGSKTATLTVNKALLTVTANTTSHVYGATITPGSGASPLSVTGMQNSETLVGTVTLAYTSGNTTTSAVGTYTGAVSPSAFVKTSGTATLSNYTINYVTNNLSVTPAALTITAVNASKCFGTEYTLGTTAFTSSGLQNSETIGSITIASSGAVSTAAVGSYAIAPSAAIGGTFTASNYTILYADGILTVNARPTSVVSGTATTCDGTAKTISVALTGTGPWNLTYTDGTTPVSITAIASSPYTFSVTPTSTKTYTVTALSDSKCTAIAADMTGSAVVTVNLSNTWIGGTIHSSWFTTSNWSCGSLPTAASDVIIQNGSQLIVDDTNTTALANTITVSANSSLTVNSGNTLKVTDKVTNDGGTITFEDTASLVQTNPAAVNSGNILYKRTTSTLNNNYDFVYWSSPVKEQKIGKIWMASNWADTFYNFNPAGNSWARTYEANTMTPGKGYIARARNGQPGWDYNNNVSTFTVGEKWSAKFYGVPNNGTITVTDCVAGRDCLLGNPYPSALDAYEFLDINSDVLEGTLYFWTHTTAMSKNAYDSNDYACYNSSGSVATRGNLVGQGSNENNKPTGKIAAGQSFFATVLETPDRTTVEFNNDMRLSTVGAPLDNTQFFRTSSAKAKTANSIEKNRVWLNVSNTQGAFKQTLVGYVTDATNAYDSRFDGESFGGNTYVDFYSINENKNLTIQGRALPFDENDTVPLGFKTSIEGSFTIDIDEVDGLLTNQAVYLEDKVTNTVSNLKNSNYTFTTAKGTFNDRFVLRYTDKTLSIDDTDQEDGILVFYSNNYKTLIIKNKVMDSIVKSVALFNMAGQNIEKWDVKDSGQTNIQIPIKNRPSGIYIVKVKTTKGESSKKIIVN